MRRSPEQPMMIVAKRLGKSLYREYKKEKPRGCHDLLLEWVKSCFWGAAIKEVVPTFKESWDFLDKHKHTRKNKFIYGDIDVGVWIEHIKDKEYRKVIVSECYCSCADDNINIFVLDDCQGYSLDFKAVTAWHRERKSSLGIDWGDDRNIDYPSLNTYRKRGFDYGYNDCRDRGHVFKYSSGRERAEDAHWHEKNIPYALTTLRNDLSALKEDYSNTKV